MKPLPEDFYTRKNVLEVTRDLLGKVLITEFQGVRTSGKIVEAEAYEGATDRACHAYANRRTARTEPMFWRGGHSYVYLIYGIHPMFNIVSNLEGTPHAILIRGLEPLKGVDLMQIRRKKKNIDHTLTAGPGSLARALGITTAHTGLPLVDPPIWVEDQGFGVPREEIITSERVGVDYAGEDAKLPYRFRIKNNPWTSPAK